MDILDKELTVLKPGQTVRVVRTVNIAIDVDIKEYLDGSGDTDITVLELESDIKDNMDLHTMLDMWDDAEITDITVTVTEILK